VAKRRVMLAIVGVFGTAVVIVVATILLAVRPSRDPAQLYARLIPSWQIFRYQEPRHSDSPAARAMLRAARPWPPLAEELRQLDLAYPDDLSQSVARTNRAARAASVPYWLEIQTVKGRPVLLSHRVERIRHWRGGDRQIEVLHLRRQDNLNIEMGLVGQASSNGPLVFLDRVEEEWADDLARADPDGRGREAHEAAVHEVGRALIADRAREQVGAVVHELANQLGERLARFNIMQHRMKVVVANPSGLLWSDRWFAYMDAQTKFDGAHVPLVFDSDLREVRRANQALRKPEYAKAMAALVELRAESVEAHEARHALDDPSPPMPPLLRAWPDPDFAVQINQEIRAYLGELHDAPRAACLGLVDLTRAAYGPRARPTPHFFAGRIIVHALAGPALPEAHPGQATDANPMPAGAAAPVDPVKFMRSECAVKPSDLRERVAKLWRTLFGEAMPEINRSDGDS
jgi:hypothetical protein